MDSKPWERGKEDLRRERSESKGKEEERRVKRRKEGGKEGIECRREYSVLSHMLVLVSFYS